MKRYLFAILVILFASENTLGQLHEAEQYNTNNHTHEFKKFRIAVNLAHAYIPTASTTDNKLVIIPVWGLDFQYWFNPKWGIALKNDIEIAKYIINLDGSDELRDNPIIISLPLFYSPWDNGLAFFTGPGIELEEHTNFSIFRFGIAYELEFGNHWDFAPELVYDLKDGHINSLTLAIGVGKRF